MAKKIERNKNNVVTKRKLQLEILNENGEVQTTHHFYYNTTDNQVLHLTVGERRFILKPNGTLTWDVPDDPLSGA